MARFDPMNVAVDWLDAYQDSSLNRIVALHSRDAVIECTCAEKPKNIHGRNAIADYWRHRFVDTPSLGLEVLKADKGMAAVSYRTINGTIQAVLEVANDGLITRCRCGPAVRAERDWPYVLSLAATVTMGLVAVSVLLFAT